MSTIGIIIIGVITLLVVVKIVDTVRKYWHDDNADWPGAE